MALGPMFVNDTLAAEAKLYGNAQNKFIVFSDLQSKF
jgi:hypothetical protein